MELNWSTFILEIINFLVLVWILKRFFYKPVQAVIARRRNAIEQEMAEAKRIREEAEATEAQYQNRLGEWEKEREAARQTLRGEIEAERTRLKEALATELQQEREKARVLDERRLADARQQAEAAALSLADRFARQLLQQLAGPEMEARIVDMARQELATMSQEQQEAVREAWMDKNETIIVQSAYPLDKPLQQALQEAFKHILGAGHASWRFRQDPELIAGIHISVGAWTLAANLRDEMLYFREAGNDNE